MRIDALDDLAVKLPAPRRRTPCAAGCCGPKLMLKVADVMFESYRLLQAGMASFADRRGPT